MGTVAVTPPVPSDPSAAPPVLPRRNAFTIPTGHYAIGLNPGEAQFHDQTPRHEVLLQAFTIDRYLVGKDRSLAKGGTPATGLTFFDAQERCAQLGLRLPTEQEWEIAAQDAGFKTLPGVFEWTDSWYEGYPGNTRSEEGYGQIHKVLKGSEDGSTEAVFARRFMSPNQLNPQVGFRCVKDQP
jgi:formylglycine-generating enzyme required for sulfatase activity